MSLIVWAFSLGAIIANWIAEDNVNYFCTGTDYFRSSWYFWKRRAHKSFFLVSFSVENALFLMQHFFWLLVFDQLQWVLAWFPWQLPRQCYSLLDMGELMIKKMYVRSFIMRKSHVWYKIPHCSLIFLKNIVHVTFPRQFITCHYFKKISFGFPWQRFTF